MKYKCTRIIPIYDSIIKTKDEKGKITIKYVNYRFFGIDENGLCHKIENVQKFKIG